MAVKLRRLSQIFFLLLFVYILWPKAFPQKEILSPLVLFKIDPLIVIMTSLSTRTIMFGALVSCAMLGLTLIFGRFFCGWICPMGSSIDLAGFFRKGSFLKKDSINRRTRKIKFIVLSLAAGTAIFAKEIAWMPDPIVIISRAASSKPMLVLFLVICFSSPFVSRLWCRAVCPLGALYALFAKFALLGRTVHNCAACGTCKSECRMAAIKDDLDYVKSECILCMDCLYDCPQNFTRFEFRAIAKK